MKVFISIWLTILSQFVHAQTGIYRLITSTGASSTVEVRRMKNRLCVDVFAWWNIASGTHGTFSGEGAITGDSITVKHKDHEGCSVRLIFDKRDVSVQFSNCEPQNLPVDFSGIYRKLTFHTSGTYQTRIAKTYFYTYPKLERSRKSYLKKGAKVHVDIENIIDDRWVYINFQDSKGKISSGYILWSSLKL